MTTTRILILVLVMTALAPAAPRAAGQPVVVSAAVSLTDALQDAATAWQARTGEQVTLNLGASSMLARQITAGAKVDLFISADEAQLDVVQRAGLVSPASRVDLLGNALVVAVPSDRPLAISSVRTLLDARVRRIAIGDPNGVPAGVYARRYLEAQGIWRALQPKLVPAGSVRLALAAVENGAADAAIVYRTDLALTTRARLAWVVPAADAPRIVYPAAVLASGQQAAAAARFLAFLKGPEAGAIFRRAGFVPLAAPPR